MKLPVAYIFLPAQEFTVRIAAAAQSLTRRARTSGLQGNNGQSQDTCTVRNKKRARAKFQRGFLEMEAA